MARSPIPVTDREWPEYEYRPFPKQIGLDANGNAIDVIDEHEERARAGEVVYPKLLGKDKHGKDVIASSPPQEVWMALTIVRPKEDPKVREAAEAEAAELARKAAEYDRLMAEKAVPEEAKRGPGRPPKSEAA